MKPFANAALPSYPLPMQRKVLFFLVALVMALGLDQASKVWARASLKPMQPQSIVVVQGFFDLQYSENTGSAFGLFRSMPGGRYFLGAIGILALGLVFVYLKKAPPQMGRLGAELGLLAGGAIGNIYDRVVYGRVTDFIVWKVGSHHWPTFNIADAALVVGVVGLFFDMRSLEAAAEESPAARTSAASSKRT